MPRLNQTLLQKLKQVSFWSDKDGIFKNKTNSNQAFEKRPVWVKQSLLAQFSEEEQGEMKRLATSSLVFCKKKANQLLPI